jgi:hypothetical protein
MLILCCRDVIVLLVKIIQYVGLVYRGCKFVALGCALRQCGCNQMPRDMPQNTENFPLRQALYMRVYPALS